VVLWVLSGVDRLQMTNNDIILFTENMYTIVLIIELLLKDKVLIRRH